MNLKDKVEALQEKLPKVLIAIPCGETLETEFVKSVLQIRAKSEIRIEFLAGSLVYVAREKLAEKAIEGGYDYVLWLDSDMVFNGDVLQRFLDDDVDFVSGLYFTRKAPITPCIFDMCKIDIGDNAATQYWDYPKDDIFEIEACGFGGVLVKTKVLEDVIAKYHTAFTPVLGAGEDIAFCVRARDVGYKLHCDSRVKMGHVMRSLSTEQLYLATRANI